MSPDEAREVVLSFPEAMEGEHHGHPDFRVGNKIFATLAADRRNAVLRLPTPLAEALCAERPQVLRIVSRSGGMGWLAIPLEGADPGEFRELAEIAYDARRQAQKR